MLAIGSVPDDVLWIGRQEEFDTVTAAVRALADGRGQALLVEGEPGIGKTQLAHVLVAQAAELGCQVLCGRADQLTADFPLQVLLDAVGPAKAPDGEVPPWPPLQETSQPWTSSDPVLVLTERVLARIDQLCVVAPTVLVVDDLQWADKPSISAWARLVSATSQAALLLVGTCRTTPEWPERSKVRHVVRSHRGTVLELQPLPTSDVAELAAQIAGHSAGPALRQAVSDAGGNPLYVREVVEALLRGGLLVVDEGVVDIVDGRGRPAATLSAAITDRLEFLTPASRETLRVASLLGRGFTVSDLAVITERSALNLLPDLDEAVRAGVLAEAGNELSFRHGLIRDSLYLSMPATLRTALHRDAAKALHSAGAPLERVATQLMSAPESADSWTANWLTLHGAALAARMPVVAEELIAGVLEQGLVDESGRADLEHVLVASAFRHRSFEVVTRMTKQLLTGTSSPDRAAELSWMLGYSLLSTGLLDEALTVVADMMSRASSVWSIRLQALYALGMLSNRSPRQAHEHAEQVLRATRSQPDGFAAGYAGHALSLAAWQAGQYQLAVDTAGQALADLGDLDLPELKLLLLANRTAWSENAQEAKESLHMARTIAGDEVSSSMSTNLALAAAGHFYRTGSWDDALSELDIASAVQDTYLDRRHMRLGLAAMIAARRGLLDDAETCLGHVSPVSEANAFSQIALIYVRLAQVEIQAQKGSTADLIGLIDDLLVPDNTDLASIRHRWIVRIVRAALRAGAEEQASRGVQLASTDAGAEREGARRMAARWCEALVNGDVPVLDSCAHYYAETGYPPLFADASGDAAVACAALGDSAGARRRLTATAEIHQMLSTEHELRRTAAVLRSLGVRMSPPARSPRPTTGWDALTATEQRVAALVAQGLSNPDIAAVLFLSRRTVQTHVSHIMTKLDARSRVEVAVQSAKWAPA